MRSFTLLLVLLSAKLFSQNFEGYEQHIAPDRLLLTFQPGVTAEAKDKLLRETKLISSFGHLPHPAVTIAFCHDRNAAAQFFVAQNEVSSVSFFITDGKEHYAGVLPEVLLKLSDENFEPLLRSKMKELGLVEPTRNQFMPLVFKIQNSKLSNRNTVELAELLSLEPWCEYAAPNYLVNPLVCSNDNLFPRQWSIENTGSPLQSNGTPDADMDVDSAWTITEGSANIKIAVIDAGVDTLHPDLMPNLLPGYDAVGDSTNGYPTPNFEEDGHGTCCAGIIAAVKDNTIGIAGVAPQCKIIPVRGFYYVNVGQILPYSSTEIFSNAISWSWAVAQADVLSNSWGLPAALIGVLPGGTPMTDSAIAEAHQQGRNGKGVPMFFSSGNEDDTTTVIWPSSLPETIAVGASTMCDERKNPNDCSPESWASNAGAGLDFAAPGVRIPATDMLGANGFSNNEYYLTFNGTSAACPNAAGVGALLLSVNDQWTAEDIRNIMAQSAEKVGGYNYDSLAQNGTWSVQMGYGRVNAYQALLYAQTYVGVGEVKEGAQQLLLFPNPNSGRFSVLTQATHTQLNVLDVNGQILAQRTLASGRTDFDFTAQLSAGFYFVQLVANGKTSMQRLVVMK